MEEQTKTEGTPGKVLVIIEDTDKIIDKSKQLMIAETIGTEESLNRLEEQYKGLIVAGITDKVGYTAVKDGIKNLKSIKTNIENLRKELTAPALKFQKGLIEEAKRINERLDPLIAHLDAEKKRIDDAKAAEDARIFRERNEKLVTNGWTVVGNFYICGALQFATADLKEMTPERFDFYYQEGVKEVERKKAAEAAAEAQQAELDRLKRELEEEREKLRKEREELAAQKEGLEKTYGALDQPAQEAAAPGQAEQVAEPQEAAPVIDVLGDAPAVAPAAPAAPAAPKQQAVITRVSVGTLGQPTASGSIEGNPYAKFGPGFILGFDNMRLQIIKHLQSDEKITRQGLIEWAKAAKPNV